jgi:rhodanese-related sulfurtransferase
MIVVAGAALAAPAAGARTLDGEVLSRVGDLFLIRSSGGEQVVKLELGAEIVGAEQGEQILNGDRVRVTWSRERSGVKVGELLEVAPPIGLSGVFAVQVESVPTAPDGAARPLLVDLRSPASFRARHLPGAISVPGDRLRDLAKLLGTPQERKLVFYGERRVTREIADALRRARVLGWREVGYLQGGIRAWDESGRPLMVAPDALAEGDGGAAHTILDMRERERALAGTIPGAISLPRSGWRWQEFTDGRTLPIVVLVAEDAQDARPFEAAEQIRVWTAAAVMRRVPTILILEGGWKAWSAGERKVATGAAVPARLVWTLGPGEVEREEFHAAYGTDAGPRGPLVVDVSNDRTAPAWGKNIPLGELLDRLGELPRDREIFLYCRVGRQAEIARAILAKEGFRARFLNGTNP